MFFNFVGVLTAAAEAVRSGRPVEKRSSYSVPWILDSKFLRVNSLEKKNAEIEGNQDDVLAMFCVPNTHFQSSVNNGINEFHCFVFVKFSSDQNHRFFSYEKVYNI